MDEKDDAAVAAAEQSLHSLGIPVGKDAKTREQIIRELKRKGRDEFLRDWVIRQETELRNLQTQLQQWQTLYLKALDEIYQYIADEAARAKFLVDTLGNSQSGVRLWAIRKVYDSRVGGASKLPAELGPVLINLVSDDDRDVRLQTAKLLSLMVQLNSSRKLLQQLEVETDDEVKTQCLISLGGACHYAFSPNSEFKIPEQIRQKALEWAEQYLVQTDSRKARAGAEVIKKLLEQDGFTPEQVDKYLGLLVERLSITQPADEQLATDLLKAMGTLCAQSVYKQQAGRKFAAPFEKSLVSESDSIRLAAVDGLIYIDMAGAFGLLKTNLLEDNNPAINQRLIELAGQVGGEQDLVWLAQKSTVSGSTEPAWQAMVKIFRRSSFRVVTECLEKFARQDTPVVLNAGQRLLLLEMAEQRGLSEQQTDAIVPIREQLAQLYIDLARYEKAAEYLGMLRQAAETEQKKQDIIAKQIDVYLRWPNLPLAVQLIEYQLLETDLEPNSVIIRSIDGFLKNPPAGADPNELLTKLSNIEPAKQRPLWTRKLKEWKSQLITAKKPEPQQSD
jgi:HEAT repeat protein